MGLIAGAGWHVRAIAAGRHFESVDDVPARRVALVLGCSPRVKGGRENVYFRGRVDAAAELWHSGKVRYLLVSGDNRTVYYNEPAVMKEALLSRGVAEERIVLDYAGRRTLDSVVRAKEVFRLEELIIVSQSFHNERALFLAEMHGLDAVGFDAPAFRGPGSLRNQLRESMARVKACLDVYVLDTQPHFLGEPIEIGEGDAA